MVTEQRTRGELGRVVVVAGHASFSAPVAGGAWTMISSDHGAASPSMSDWPAMSPDGRIVADMSPSGMVLSIDGAPPRVVHSPDGEDGSEPWFEPRGGLDKAIVSGLVSKKMWLASADLTTGWTSFASTTGYCQWVGRTALCEIGDQVVAVTDDGKQVVPLARSRFWTIAAGHVFYLAPRGGLFVIDSLPQPAPQATLLGRR